MKFDQPTTGFRFDEKYLASPVCRTRTELDHWLRDAPADLLYMPGRNETISSHIRRTLEHNLRTERRFPAFDQICQELHMSPQVVRRRLAEEGEHFQQLKDMVRAELIKELLVNTELTIADIADRAGFHEVASLSRAFKKWTNRTPIEYRQSHSAH